jgi:CRP-like cAMP-binding protein
MPHAQPKEKAMDPSTLRSIPLFADLSKKERALVAQNADEVDVPEGRRLILEGELAAEFFAIESGRVEVRHGDEVIRGLGQGDFFGEIGVLAEDARRTASVVATAPTTLVVLTGQALRSINRQMPSVAQHIREALAERVGQTG